MTEEAGESPLRGIDVVVLAGGLGTRIRSVLGDTPKVLADIDGTPLLDRLLDRLERYGADRVVLCLGHLAEKVVAHLGERPPRACGIVTLVEREPLGTAGALAFVRPHLRPGPALVLNGDTLVDADLGRLVAFHRGAAGADGSGVAATLLCLEMPDTGRYGRVDAVDGRIHRFAEKDEAATGPGTINAGVYMIEPSLLDTIARLRTGSLERDVFQTLPPGKLGACVDRFRFVDIGIPSSLAQAQGFYQ